MSAYKINVRSAPELTNAHAQAVKVYTNLYVNRKKLPKNHRLSLAATHELGAFMAGLEFALGIKYKNNWQRAYDKLLKEAKKRDLI